MDPPTLKAEPYSEMTVTVVPVNLLGFKTPFSKVGVRFQIEEGANLIELSYFTENNKAVIRSKGLEGEAILGVYSLKSGILLHRLLIKIYSGNLV